MIPGRMVKGMAARWTWSPGQARRRADGDTAKDEAKLLHRCTLPLTGAGVVDMVNH